MMPDVLNVFVLAIVQGVCELLPVSSSAHVIIAEKLMGLDPTTPAMTFLLVMLHTGTMLAVIAYFWNTWRSRFFSSAGAFRAFARNVVVATACTRRIRLAGRGRRAAVRQHHADRRRARDGRCHDHPVGTACARRERKILDAAQRF